MVANGRSKTENGFGTDARPAAMRAVSKNAEFGEEAERVTEGRRLCPA
jgi:hypothetical protein